MPFQAKARPSLDRRLCAWHHGAAAAAGVFCRRRQMVYLDPSESFDRIDKMLQPVLGQRKTAD